jgi:hypothetical protein
VPPQSGQRRTAVAGFPHRRRAVITDDARAAAAEHPRVLQWPNMANVPVIHSNAKETPWQ